MVFCMSTQPYVDTLWRLRRPPFRPSLPLARQHHLALTFPAHIFPAQGNLRGVIEPSTRTRGTESAFFCRPHSTPGEPQRRNEENPVIGIALDDALSPQAYPCSS